MPLIGLIILPPLYFLLVLLETFQPPFWLSLVAILYGVGSAMILEVLKSSGSDGDYGSTEAAPKIAYWFGSIAVLQIGMYVAILIRNYWRNTHPIETNLLTKPDDLIHFGPVFLGLGTGWIGALITHFAYPYTIVENSKHPIDLLLANLISAGSLIVTFAIWIIGRKMLGYKWGSKNFEHSFRCYWIAELTLTFVLIFF